MKLLVLDRYSSPFYILISILLINYFGFSYSNIYWWSFYIISISFFVVLLVDKIHKNSLSINTHFLKPMIFLAIFCIIGIYATLINQANWIDSLYVTVFRMAPILLILISYDFASNVDWSTKNKVIRRFEKILFFLFIIVLPVGFIQKFMLKLSFDDIAGFTSNAHIFSFIILITSVFIYLKEKRFWTFLLIIVAIVLSILADFKIGIISFFLSVFITLIIIRRINGQRILKQLVFSIISILGIISLIYLFREQLPGRFSLIFIIENISIKSLLLDLNSTFPADLELFKGYIQLYLHILDDINKFLFGLGPGNYATNVAIAKTKYYAYTYVIQYRDILDSYDIANGSLLSRNGVLINIIAEYGHIGAFFYLISFFLISLFPIKFYLNYKKQLTNKNSIFAYLFTYILIICYTYLEIPVFPILNEGINIAILGIFGVLLIAKVRDQMT